MRGILMLRRFCVFPIVVVLLITFLPFIQANELSESILPDMAFYTMVETPGEVRQHWTYYKDGKTYISIDDELWLLDQDTIGFFVDELSEHLDGFESKYDVREVGPAVVSNRETTHYQIFSQETGLLVGESWIEPDAGIAIQSISYDPEGNILEKRVVLEMDFFPDFSHLDFSRAEPFPFLSTAPRFTSLTKEEFEKLVPWYDLSQQPLDGFDLVDITSKGYHILDVTLTYSDGEESIRVKVLGTRDKLAEIHGPSEFSLLTRITWNGTALEPGTRSLRTEVMVGFMDPISRSDGSIFLNSVVLHPAAR